MFEQIEVYRFCELAFEHEDSDIWSVYLKRHGAGDRWVIRHNGWWVNREGDWQFEPVDPDHILVCSFDDARDIISRLLPQLRVGGRTLAEVTANP